jgi:acyl carrier protein
VPLSDITDALTHIWADALGVASLDQNANFFDLGGNSLHAVKIVTGVRELLDIDMPPDLFFQAPTIGRMAGELATLVAR